MKHIGALLALGMLSGAAHADVVDNSPPAETFTQEQIAAISYPDMTDGAMEPGDPDSDKYFFFHRDDTAFEEAFADISECDALASGMSYYHGGNGSMMNYYAVQYGIGGVIGGAIGSAIGDAIFGSAERRKMRRDNLRACMGFKEYQRYALEKDIWSDFNFEEGNSSVPDDERRADLLVQAKVASGPKPQFEVLQP